MLIYTKYIKITVIIFLDLELVKLEQLTAERSDKYLNTRLTNCRV